MGSAFGKYGEANRPRATDQLAARACFLTFMALISGFPVDAQFVRLDSIVVVNASGQPKTVLPRDPISLPAQQNFLTFYCSAARPTPITYRLTGLDDNWVTGLSTDHIHVANLAGGIYEFQVRDQTAIRVQQPIQIDVPFWKRVWFWPVVGLYIVGVLSTLIYLFVRYRFLQKLRYLKVRDRIARDLHDDMGSYLSSISILSQTAHRNALRNPEKTQTALDSIGQTARQVMESMNDMVWSINPTHDSMAHVLTRMSDVASNLFADTDIEFRLQIGDDVGTFTLPAEARRDFFLVYKEALTNAARYAQATRIGASVARTQQGLTLVVQDNGGGFNPQQPDYQNPGGGNGLKNMHTRAGQFGGQLTITSAPGQGTTVQLYVPGGLV